MTTAARSPSAIDSKEQTPSTSVEHGPMGQGAGCDAGAVTNPPHVRVTLKPGAKERLQRQVERARAVAQEPQCGYGRRRAAEARSESMDVAVRVGSVQVASMRLPTMGTLDAEEVAFLRRKVLAAFDDYYGAPA